MASKKRKGSTKALPDEQAKSFIEWLKSWVAKHCVDNSGREWSQARVAERLGISQGEYSQWLNDRARPGIARLVKLRAFIGVPLDEMLGLSRVTRESGRPPVASQVRPKAGVTVKKKDEAEGEGEQ